MDDELRTLRRRIARTKADAGGRRRYSEELRVEVIEYAVRREQEGDTRVDVARELGLTHRTLWGWLHRHHEPMVKPVEIVDDRVDETEVEARCLVLPGGSRIEGLSIEDVVVLVRALS